MKDYPTERENRKTFILNYEIKEGQMIVSLASGETYILPYTIENELMVLKMMKKQVKNYANNEDYKEETNDLKICGVKFILGGLIVGGSILFLGSGMVVTTIVGIVFLFFTLTMGIGGIILSTKELEDLEKNELFLEYEKQINNNEGYQSEKTRNKKQQLLEKINQERPKLYEEESLAPIESTEVPLFNLNTIDKISYEELKSLTNLIDLDEKFNPKKEKGYVKKKKKNME